MKILVVGNGAREHAIIWKLITDGISSSEIVCAPGNAGISQIVRCAPIGIDDPKGLFALAKNEEFDLVIVGPELPLALGLADLCRENKIAVVGPNKEAAQLESSKSFAKEVMKAAKVPNASYQVFTERGALQDYLTSQPLPTVLKADGLAGGKGVVILNEQKELAAAVEFIFGELKAEKVVVEEFLDGVEASLMAVSNGEYCIALPPAHDYKRIFDADKGPNTGGMGSVCPTPRLSPDETEWVIKNICDPVVTEMKRRGTPFCGFLYAGLMVPQESSQRMGGIKVIEFNVRLGDPETQSIVKALSSPFLPILQFAAGTLGTPPKIPWPEIQVVSVVMAAKGYPGVVQKGDVITGLDRLSSEKSLMIFHAGTTTGQAGEIVTSSGRVLTVSASAQTIEEAKESAYRAVQKINFNGAQYRNDISS